MSELRPNNAYVGLNLDSTTSEVKPGQLTYALNAQVAGFEGNSVTYQNEPANQFCFTPPEGYVVIGVHNIIEISTVIYWLTNPATGDCEIGKVLNNSCVYETVINSTCLNFNVNYPILKAVHKLTSCTTEVYWTDGYNRRRWIDLDNLPYTEVIQGTSLEPCEVITTSVIDCNRMEIQPNFAIPEITYLQVSSEGSSQAGTVQFAFQYCDSLGGPYTSFYSVTNPLPIYDFFKVTPDFDYFTAKSVQLQIDNIDTTGVYSYFNVAVIKTVNDIPSVQLVGTYQIEGASQKIIYTGQSKAGINLTINDIFEKFLSVDVAQDVMTTQECLVWDGLTIEERVSYQQIINNIKLQWVSHILPPSEGYYRNEINVGERRGYMRDEVYAFDAVIILKNGYQSDRFHIPGRSPLPTDLEMVDNNDSNIFETVCQLPQAQPRWQVYNTGSVLGYDPTYLENEDNACYQGPYQYGDFSYWESTETYPCDEKVWGSLAGQQIRHHKFPDSSVTYHHDAQGNIFPLGIRVNTQDIYNMFVTSNLLTQEQKDKIAAIKIVRSDRTATKSIIAKGLLYNVGSYTKLNSTYYYPNYPFNDLRPDPFIQDSNYSVTAGPIVSSYAQIQSTGNTPSTLYSTEIIGGTFQNAGDQVIATYRGTFGNSGFNKDIQVYFGNNLIFDLATNLPQVPPASNNSTWAVIVTIVENTPNSVTCSTKYVWQSGGGGFGDTYITVINNIDLSTPQEIVLMANTTTIPNSHGYNSNAPVTTETIDGITTIISQTDPLIGDITTTSEQIVYVPAPVQVVPNTDLDGFSSPASLFRYTFHSPDTSFYQPFLGNILKLEAAESGTAKGHFVEVKNHAKYSFPSLNSYLGAVGIGIAIGFASGTYGVADNVFNGTAAFTAITMLTDIVYKIIPRRNFCYQFNSLGSYINSIPLPNDTGNKIRQVDIAAYLIPGLQGVGDLEPVNNYQRESSVYFRTTQPLPFVSDIPGVPQDISRFTLGNVGCNLSYFDNPISSYYASNKIIFPDQYGQIYSYSSLDTGFQMLLDLTKPFSFNNILVDIFGGDTFINQFALKRKMPFFLDNRVNPYNSVIYPDNSDIFYDELGNVGYPKYWFSTDVQQGSGSNFSIGELFGVKVHNFDCKDNNFFYDSGKIYLFAYGIAQFFVESTVNVDMRQAYNSREGDYYPHVSGDLPDDWLQETYVPINYDNTYTYNKSYSKQNAENLFTTLPVDFVPNEVCQEVYPNKAVYSDPQRNVVNYETNDWLIYRPASQFDFPLEFGKLISLDSIENSAILARFENQSKIYNSLLTIDTSNPQAAYLGNNTLFSSAPPIDFSHTDLGYGGSQNKFFLKTEYGNISVDAKRGQVFSLEGRQALSIGDAGLTQFFRDNLPFAILESFPEYNIDNSFNGVGITGVFDSKYDRMLITKLDYRCTNPQVVYNPTTFNFSINGETIQLGDPNYFCNTSFTLSYWFKSKSWISFHSYLPNFYIGDNNKFTTGIGGSIWSHNTTITKYNNFAGVIAPYILEYPFAYKMEDEILQSVSDYTKVNKIIDTQRFVQTNNVFFNKAIVYNDQQNSGLLNLVPKPVGNLQAYNQFPNYNADSKDIMFVRSGNFYNYNGFWDIVADNSQPIWVPSCVSTSYDKQLNTSNLNYQNSSYKKYPIRGKDCRIRQILDNTSDYRLTSQFMISQTQISYK